MKREGIEERESILAFVRIVFTVESKISVALTLCDLIFGSTFILVLVLLRPNWYSEPNPLLCGGQRQKWNAA